LTGIGTAEFPYIVDSIGPDVCQLSTFHYFIEKTFIPNISLTHPCIHRGPPKTA
jgi:hypothetical protein